MTQEGWNLDRKWKKKAYALLEFIRYNSGVDWMKSQRRYLDVGVVFIPSKVENHYGNEVLSLYNLLEEVQKAYILGLDRASISLCRALTELVLARHYAPELCLDYAGRVQAIPLEGLIDECERKYPHLKKKNLHAKRRLANKILHPKEITERDLLTAREWIRELKNLIEEAPDLIRKKPVSR